MIEIMNIRKQILLLLLCLPFCVQAKNITISRLTCEMQEGLVVVETHPRLMGDGITAEWYTTNSLRA
ncbi:alpha-L-rhamnosidase [Bacteroides reticulotermitis JCM 10512]|uniref:Alpha-L-rhamnosidase n=1 Tax=Bacteroides reticulotermitis JCM 10512 TaxID=1445607 RepID=W4UTS4_9BACE|nr:alpha-L-rhamnosidase [Bacteroides reticulotermitis JCM 10512]